MRSPTLQPVLSAAALVLAGTAWAQPQGEGPVIVGERLEGFKAFELEYLNAALEFYGQSLRDTRTQAGQPDLTDREDIFRETFELSGRMFFWHERFVDLSGTVQLRLEDRLIDSDSQGLDAHHTDLAGLYDLSALILANGPVPVTAYSRRDETRLNREFAGTIRGTTSESGLIAQIKSERVPTGVHYFHREQDESDPAGFTDYGLTQDTLSLQSQARPADGQRLELDATFDRINEARAIGGDDAYDRSDARLTHTLDFGTEDEHQLRSVFRYYDRTGFFPHNIIRLDEQLRLRHSDRFETRYDASADLQERGSEEQRFVRGAASLRHELFESLVTTATLGVQRLDTNEDFASDEYFANGAFDYTKLVPYGLLDVTLAGSFNAQSNSERGGFLSIFDEPRVFRDPFPVVISRRNIVPTSVVVTDAAGVRLYFEGLDYTLLTFPDRVELRRVLGGAIADGQTVLVDYLIGPEAANSIDTVGTNVSVRYTITEGSLSGLSAYVRYRRLDQSLDAADPSLFVLEDARTTTYGTEYRAGPLTLRAELENRDSTTNPLDLLRLDATYVHRLDRGSQLIFDATHEVIDYPLDGNKVEFDRVSGRWTQRINRELSFGLRLLYRDERNQASGDSRGLEEVLELNWQRRQTSVYAAVRNSNLDAEATDTESQSFVFGLRRSF